MWDCLHVEDSLSQYVDGYLTSSDRRSLESHVRSCPSCADSLESIREAVDRVRGLSAVHVPDRLLRRILAVDGVRDSEAVERCEEVEGRLAALASGDVDPVERDRLLGHVQACRPCRELHGALAEALSWARTFPQHPAPRSLVARILEETTLDETALDETALDETMDAPSEVRIVRGPVPSVSIRETWFDTLAYVGRWMMEPRTAMMVLTSVLMMGWILGLAGVRPDVRALSSPETIYDSVQSIADDVYDEGVRLYYSVPHAVLGEVQARIERLREES